MDQLAVIEEVEDIDDIELALIDIVDAPENAHKVLTLTRGKSVLRDELITLLLAAYMNGFLRMGILIKGAEEEDEDSPIPYVGGTH